MRNLKYRPLYLIKSKFTGEYYTWIKLDVLVSNVTFDLYTKQHDINNYRYSWTPPPLRKNCGIRARATPISSNETI